MLTWEDAPDWRGGTPRCKRILDRKVRHVGDSVALAAAATEEIALEALGLIEVEYDILPAVFEPEEALQPGAPRLYEEFPGNVAPCRRPPSLDPRCLKEVVMGDVEKGFPRPTW